VVPAVAEKMGLRFKIAQNAPVIATIGAALAMVRDSVERTIINPTQEDILQIRNEAEQAAIRAGASPSTIEVTVQIDTAKNTVTAVAVGSTDLSAKAAVGTILTQEQLQKKVQEAFTGKEESRVSVHAEFATDTLSAFRVNVEKKSRIPFFKKCTDLLCVMDSSGVIKLSVEGADCYHFKAQDRGALEQQLEAHMKFDESGRTAPLFYVVINGKITDLSGLDSTEQILSLVDLELKRLGSGEEYLAILKKR